MHSFLIVALTLSAMVGGPAPGALPDCNTGQWSSIGVDAWHCRGGACKNYRVHGGGIISPVLDFSVEPRVLKIAEGGPADGVLREGDSLVAVNGFLITSSRGGMELARLLPGDVAQLTIRRGDRLEQVRVFPELRCGPPIIVNASNANKARKLLHEKLKPVEDGGKPQTDRTTIGTGPIGFALSCENCSITVSGDRIEWEMPDYPVVQVVEGGSAAEEAGLYPGDVLTHVDGLELRGTEGPTLLLHGTSPRSLTLRYERDGIAHETTLQTREGDISADNAEAGALASGLLDGAADAVKGWIHAERMLFDRKERSFLASGDSWGPGRLGLTFEWCRGCNWGWRDGEFVWNQRGHPAISAVEPGGPAERAGLRPGDRVLSINEHSIESPRAGKMLLGIKHRGDLDVEIERDARRQVLTVTPREEN